MLLSMKRALLGSFLFALTAAPASSQTVMDIISRDLRFSTLVTMISAARLTNTLQGDGPFTLFAPTNQAFVVSRVNATRLLQPIWSAHLVDLLTYHVALARIESDEMEVGDEISTAQAEETIEVTSAGVIVELNNNATIIEKDKDASNGIVQVIDHVLLPISASETIYQYASTRKEYSILTLLIQKAGLVDVLNGPGPRTIFAPTDAAFVYIQGTDWEDFINDQNRVRNLLLYHLLDGNVFTQQLRELDSIQSVQGSDIDIDVLELLDGGKDDFQIILNTDSKVAIGDTLVKNGIFHTIDRVLTPPTIEDPTLAELLQEQGLSVFEAAARRTGLWDILNNPSETLTAFAAVNAGFDPEFTAILNNYDYYLHLEAAMNYQVVANQALRSEQLVPNLEMPTLLNDESLTVTQGHPRRPIIINFDSLIQEPDLDASNGVMQVIDQVIVPPFLKVDVIDVIARQPYQHSTLVYLLVLTGLIPDLSTDGPFTIFAPTNAAFEALLFNAGILVGTDWSSNIDTMREILLYHVVPAVVYEEQLTHNSTFPTLQGDTILATNTAYGPVTTLGQAADGNARRLDDIMHGRMLTDPEIPIGEVLLDYRARILQADQFAANGVVHSIDTVLIPTWGDYKPQTLENSNEFCIQWGQFEGLCCPLPETLDTEVTKQSDLEAEWYCDYFVVPDAEEP